MTETWIAAAGRSIAIAAALLCAACQSSWPPPGQGGMAETHWPEDAGDVQAPAGLHEHLRCTLGRVETLRDAAGRTGRFNGEIARLDLVAARAKREYAGALYPDSAITLSALDTAIDDVSRDLPAKTAECG